MPSANAKPTAEGSSAPLTAFSFFLPTRLREALAGVRARIRAHQFSRAVLLTSFSMKNLCLVFLIYWAATSACFGKDAYQFSTEIPIGGEGGWDILTIDPTANRLYLSHSTQVVVVDLSKNAVAGEIADTPGVHAFVAVPELQRGFSSNGKESKSSVVDLTTLSTVSKIDTGSNPDAVVYEPRHDCCAASQNCRNRREWSALLKKKKERDRASADAHAREQRIIKSGPTEFLIPSSCEPKNREVDQDRQCCAGFDNETAETFTNAIGSKTRKDLMRAV